MRRRCFLFRRLFACLCWKFGSRPVLHRIDEDGRRRVDHEILVSDYQEDFIVKDIRANLRAPDKQYPTSPW